MLRANIKIAIRNLLRQKGYSFINVFGLSFGLTCCLLITLYIRHEFSYDAFHKQGDRIYRLVEDVTVSDNTTLRASATGAAGPALLRDFPEIKQMVRFAGATMLVSHGDKRFQEEKIFFSDATVFDVFTFSLLKGDPLTALSAPSSIVLSEETAARYFGEADPMGQTLIIDNEIPFTVTGVVQNIPENTHLQFDILLSMSTRHQDWLDSWSWFAYTYVLLSPHTDANGLVKKFPEFIVRHTGDNMWQKGHSHALSLQPLSDIHLHSKRSGESNTPGSVSNLYLFSFIAVFILVIACINFVNLATAQAGRRSREIGVRKAVGGTRLQLVVQFLSEAILLSLGAAFLAIGLCDLLLPVFRQLSGISVSFETIATPLSVSVYVGISVLIGCLAGSYPAMLLSGFRTVSVLKGSYKGPSQNGSLRKGLIALQFAISMTLIAATITVFTQLRYMQNHDLGYRHNQVLALYFGDDADVQKKIELVKQELLRSPYINSLAASSHVPGKGAGRVGVEMKSENGTTQTTDIRLLAADYTFLSFYQIPLSAGRGFSPQYTNDAIRSFMINEAAATQFGFINYNDILGKQLSLNGQQGIIIGVVKDFHYESLHKRIEPLLIRMRPQSLSYLSIDIRTEAIIPTLQDLEKRWSALAPHRPFDFFFLDENFNHLYRADTQFGKMFGVFSFIAIILACLGLFGLTSFTVQQRTKEIGIRKILGASVTGVVRLLSGDFIRPVLFAVVIATPLAWYTLHRWLEDFAYRINMGVWIFLVASVLVLLIAILTVSVQSIRAALANPVDSLRNE
jgi:putative ABC transport system permease protein